MVVVAGSAEVGEFGEPTSGNGDVVVDFEVAAGFTSQDGADGVLGFDRMRRCAGIVRPWWETRVTSTPSITKLLKIESEAIRRATATGTGPRPAISHVSPGSVHPRS